MKYFGIIIFCFVIYTLLASSSCERDPCPPQYTNATVSFRSVIDSSWIDTLFTKVYGVNGSGEIPVAKNSAIRNLNYELPLSLHSESVTYIFEGPTTADTLMLSYQKVQESFSDDCGFWIKMDSLEIIYTTFAKYEIQERQQYYFDAIMIYIYL